MGRGTAKWLALVVFAPVSLLATPAFGQECVVGTAGPLTLAAGQTAKVCATNIGGSAGRRVRVAFYDAFRAREPIRTDHADLEPGDGACISLRSAARTATIVVRAGYRIPLDDPGQPLALSLQIERPGQATIVNESVSFNFSKILPQPPGPPPNV